MFIGIYKEPDKDTYLISTFGHLMFINDDRAFVDGRHIGLEYQISRAGRVMTGTKEQITEYVKEMMQLDLKYLYFAPLFDLGKD